MDLVYIVIGVLFLAVLYIFYSSSPPPVKMETTRLNKLPIPENISAKPFSYRVSGSDFLEFYVGSKKLISGSMGTIYEGTTQMTPGTQILIHCRSNQPYSYVFFILTDYESGKTILTSKDLKVSTDTKTWVDPVVCPVTTAFEIEDDFTGIGVPPIWYESCTKKGDIWFSGMIP